MHCDFAMMVYARTTSTQRPLAHPETTATPCWYCGDRAIRQLGTVRHSAQIESEAKQCGPERHLRTARADKFQQQECAYARPRHASCCKVWNDKQRPSAYCMPECHSVFRQLGICWGAASWSFSTPRPEDCLNPEASVQSLSAAGSHPEDGGGGEVEGGRNRQFGCLCMCFSSQLVCGGEKVCVADVCSKDGEIWRS